MIDHINIRNFVIIDQLRIEFNHGLNVITGETGTGKSILMGAISIILGGRASAEMIRTGCEEASVEALFSLEDDLEQLKVINGRLVSRGFSEINLNDNQLLIKRTINQNGKNKIFINGESATLNLLKTITDGLVDLCSQHEHQTLLKPYNQLLLLDKYSNSEALREEVGSLYRKRIELLNSIKEIQGNQEEIEKRSDYLKYQIQEIEQISPKLNEDADLENEKRRISGISEISHIVEEVNNTLYNDPKSIIDRLSKVQSDLEKCLKHEPKFQEYISSISQSITLIEETVFSLRGYEGEFEVNPQLLQETIDRLDALTKLKKKHGGSLDAVMEVYQELQSELEKLENRESRIESLQNTLMETEKSTLLATEALSKNRAAGAKKLSTLITSELHELNMPGSKIKIEVTQLKDLDQLRLDGLDQINFLIQTNPGEPLKPLNKVASGGELSRVMLAIRKAITQTGGIGVYLFDEVDAGIGGETGTIVGKKLKSVSLHHQVLCITHLPQVAAFADAHLVVKKFQQNNRTLSSVSSVMEKERIEEIARMLGDRKRGAAGLKYAETLVNEARL